MAHEHPITIIEEPEHLSQVAGYRSETFDENELALLTNLGSGAVRFALAAFPKATLNSIYGQNNERSSEGRGPHFDIYNKGLSSKYPWLGVYNLAGSCTVSAAIMPDALAVEYNNLYPEPTEEAYGARRHFGAIVLNAAATNVYRGIMKPDMGLVLPQRPQGPNIIHEVVPDDPKNPGSFIKLIIPKNDQDVLDSLGQQGFLPLDELLTKSIPAAEEKSPPRTPRIPREFSPDARSGFDGSGMLD